jgi:preprotein translocase subunit YajC
VEIARIPEDIRGYGHVKERHLKAARAKWDGLMAQWVAVGVGFEGKHPPAWVLALARAVGAAYNVLLAAMASLVLRAVGRVPRPSRLELMSVFISSAIAQTAPAAAALVAAIMMFSLTGMLPLVLMFVVLYFVMIRPQMKRQKEHRAMIDAIAKGDEVVTAGGMLGKVTRLSEQYSARGDRQRCGGAGPAQRRGAGAAQGHGQVSLSIPLSRMGRFFLLSRCWREGRKGRRGGVALVRRLPAVSVKARS